MKQFIIHIIGPEGLSPVDVQTALARGLDNWRLHLGDHWGKVRVEIVVGSEPPTVVLCEIPEEDSKP